MGSIRKDSEPEESEGEDGLKGDSQSIQETLALEVRMLKVSQAIKHI